MSRAIPRKPRPSPVESALARARRGQRAIVRQGREPIGAVVPIADLRLLEKLEDRQDSSVSISRLADSKEKRIPYAEIRRRAGL